MDIRKVDPKRVVASYFFIQAFATFAWWSLLLLSRDSIRLFQPTEWPPEVLLSFFLADLIFLVIGSLVAAIAVMGERTWAKTAVWIMVGAGWYPALYCVGVSVLTDEAWIASSLMVAMAGLMLAVATIYGAASQSPSLIRVVAMNRVSAPLWTSVQIVVFWGVFLWIMPRGIAELQQKIGWSTFTHDFQFECSFALFLLASAVGLWSGWVMSIYGSGTPLPTATAPKLVEAGPYGFVRNPMALTGVLQGIAIGWMLGSWMVIAGAIACGFGWHFVVRPVEESDLQERFGEDYTKYQRQVGLWLPRLVR